MTLVGKYIIGLRKTYSLKVWNLTLITILMVARKTFFNVIRKVGDFDATVDSSMSLAVVCILLSLYVINTNRKSFKYVFKRTNTFAYYYFFAFLSILWAGYAPTIAFKCMEVLCAYYVVCMTIHNIRNIKDAYYYVILLATVVTYMDVLNGFWRYGIAPHHTNAYSFTAMIGFLCSFGAIIKGIYTRKEMLIFVILNLLALLAGTSSASYISTIVGMTLLLSSGKRGVKIVAPVILCCVLYALYYIAEDIIYDLIFTGKSKAAVETGTGRQQIWEACIEKWKTSPWVGTGFLVGERQLSEYRLNLKVVSAHNTFISILVGTGVAGLLVFLRFLWQWFVKLIIFSRTNIFAVVLFPVSVAIMVNCMSTGFLGSDWGYVSSVIYAVIAFVFLKLPLCKTVSFTQYR